jgi:hypothetical protein
VESKNQVEGVAIMAVVIKKKKLAQTEKNWSVEKKDPDTGEMAPIEDKQENSVEVMTDGILSEVNVGVGLTINTGNYNSLRINVGIKRPCSALEAAEDAAYMYCKKWVAGKLEDLHNTYIES